MFVTRRSRSLEYTETISGLLVCCNRKCSFEQLPRDCMKRGGRALYIYTALALQRSTLVCALAIALPHCAYRYQTDQARYSVCGLAHLYLRDLFADFGVGLLFTCLCFSSNIQIILVEGYSKNPLKILKYLQFIYQHKFKTKVQSVFLIALFYHTN